MALSLASISQGKAKKAPRLVLLGVEGVGKSTAASQCPKPIFLPMKGEQGVDQLDTAKFPPAQSVGDVFEAIGVLNNEDHDFRTVVIDSASALEPLILEEVCRIHGSTSIETVLGGYGKGYVEALKQWRDLTEGLDALRENKGMGCVLIGHVKTKEFNDPEADPYTTYMCDLQDKASALLSKWADGVFFCNFKRAIVKQNDAGFNKKTSRALDDKAGGTRKCYTEKRPAHPGKNRYGLPYELPLDMPEILKLIGDASVATA